MKCDELKSLWVYSRDINENCDEEFVNFAKENGYEELVEKKEVTEAIAELKEFAEDACLERDDNQTAIDELQSENRKLKEERRWRKCSDEMPQNYDDGDYFLIAVEHESTISPKGYYVTIAQLVGGEWSDDEGGNISEDFEYNIEDSVFCSQAPKGTKKGFYHSKVTHWMPLPSAPKEKE